MAVDDGKLSAIYLICGFVFGVWFTYQKFRGGEDSQYYKEMRRRVPGVDAINPWVLLVGAAFGVVVWSIVWPFSLVVNLKVMRRARLNSRPLYLHPKLVELRTKLKGQEESYEEILSELGLGMAVTALHAIDLDAAVDYALEVIARKNREHNSSGPAPEPPRAQDYEDASYVNVIKVVLSYLEIRELDASRKRVNLRRALKMADEMTNLYDHIRNPGWSIGQMIAFRVHGWAPESELKRVKEKYAQHLKPEFRNADHMYTVFSGIRVTDDRDVKHVVAKGADLSADEYNTLTAQASSPAKGVSPDGDREATTEAEPGVPAAIGPTNTPAPTSGDNTGMESAPNR